MKIEVTKTLKSTDTIEVDLPYYYRHDLLTDHADCIIYGKIEEDKHTSIQINQQYSCSQSFSVEIEIENTSWFSLSCYLSNEYKSDEKTYTDAKNKALEIIKNA